MTRLDDLWWRLAPTGAGRLARTLHGALTGGAYLRAWRPVGSLAPLVALLLGGGLGAFHPLMDDQLLVTSVPVVAGLLLLGGFAPALGAWAVIGYAVADLVTPTRVEPFGGSLESALRTRAALPLCDVVIFLAVVLVPLAARGLAEGRGRRRAGTAIAVAAVCGFALTAAWSQAAVALTRPYYTWHPGLAPSHAAFQVRDGWWKLALATSAGIVLGGVVELLARRRSQAALVGTPEPRALAAGGPAWLTTPLKAALTVAVLAGLMDTWWDALAVVVVLSALLLLREPAVLHLGGLPHWMAGRPLLLRLVAGAVVSAGLAILLAGLLTPSAAFRPVVASTVISLVVFAIVLPDHILHHHAQRGAAASEQASPRVAADGPS